MKKIIFSFLMISLFSCSNDAEETPADNNLAATTYISLSSNNYWKYRIESTNGSLPTIVAPVLDHLKVGNDVTISGNTYKLMEAQGASIGFYTGLMNQKNIRKVSDELQFTGNVTLEIGNNIPTQNIPVENFIFFKESATNGTQISFKDGTLAPIPTTIPLNGTNISGNINVAYKIKYVAGETLSTFTPPVPNSGTPATTYANVKSVKFVLNVKLTFSYLLGGTTNLNIQLLNPTEQDVVISTNYYAKDKGVVYTQTNTNYTFANSPGTTTPLLPPTSNLQREYVTEFLNN